MGMTGTISTVKTLVPLPSDHVVGAFSPDGAWFYRYSDTNFELLNPYTTNPENAVMASWEPDMWESEDGSASVTIEYALPITLNGCLNFLLVLTNQKSKSYYTLFKPFYNSVGSSFPNPNSPSLSNVNAVCVSEQFMFRSSTTGSMSAHKCCLIVAAMNKDTIHVTRLSEKTGSAEYAEHVYTFHTGKEGKIKSLCIWSPVVCDDAKCPILFVGSDEGEILVYAIQQKVTRNTTPIARYQLPENGPVSVLKFIQPPDSVDLILAVGQDSNQKDSPPSATFLHVQRIGSTVEISSVGNISYSASSYSSSGVVKAISMSSVRKSNEISIFVAFEVDATYLYYAKISPSGGLEIFKMDQSDTDGLLDILSVKNTNMCRLLSNSKFLSYIPDVNTKVDPVQARTSVQKIMRLGEYHSPNFRDFFGQMLSGFPYSAEYKGHVMAIRQRVDGAIIFDSLLRLQGIDSSSYPPEDMPSFETLVKTIWDNDNIQPILRHALIYYLFLDWGDLVAPEYAVRYIPNASVHNTMKGYWAIDHGDFHNALKHLTERRHIDCAFKIMQILHNCGEPLLALKFIRTVKPDLDKDGIKLQMDILLQTNLWEALEFQRRISGQNPHFSHSELLYQLLDFCFKDKDASLVKKLLNFPFNSHEESLLFTYCQDSGRLVCYEFLVIYYIHHGRYVEAITLHEQMTSLSADTMELDKPGINRGALSVNMHDIIQGLRATLPDIVKKAIELQPKVELKPLDTTGGRQKPPETPIPPPTQDNRLASEELVPFSASKSFRESTQASEIHYDPQRSMLRALSEHQLVSSRTTPSASTAASTTTNTPRPNAPFALPTTAMSDQSVQIEDDISPAGSVENSPQKAITPRAGNTPQRPTLPHLLATRQSKPSRKSEPSGASLASLLPADPKMLLSPARRKISVTNASPFSPKMQSRLQGRVSTPSNLSYSVSSETPTSRKRRLNFESTSEDKINKRSPAPHHLRDRSGVDITDDQDSLMTDNASTSWNENLTRRVVFSDEMDSDSDMSTDIPKRTRIDSDLSMNVPPSEMDVDMTTRYDQSRAGSSSNDEHAPAELYDRSLTTKATAVSPGTTSNRGFPQSSNLSNKGPDYAAPNSSERSQPAFSSRDSSGGNNEVKSRNSGTSALAGVLSSLGSFIGGRKSRDGDAQNSSKTDIYPPPPTSHTSPPNADSRTTAPANSLGRFTSPTVSTPSASGTNHTKLLGPPQLASPITSSSQKSPAPPSTVKPRHRRAPARKPPIIDDYEPPQLRSATKKQDSSSSISEVSEASSYTTPSARGRKPRTQQQSSRRQTPAPSRGPSTPQLTSTPANTGSIIRTRRQMERERAMMADSQPLEDEELTSQTPVASTSSARRPPSSSTSTSSQAARPNRREREPVVPLSSSSATRPVTRNMARRKN